VYIDLNSAIYLEFSDEEISAKLKLGQPPLAQKVFRTKNYNTAIFIEVTIPESIHTLTINNIIYPINPSPPRSNVIVQLCLVFKDEWHIVPTVIGYYKRVHKVERFILYDNNSESPPPTEILSDPQIHVVPWKIPYKHTLIPAPTSGPDWIIIAQNSAYSHCLKKFSQATWTILMDTDEFLVRRRDKPALKTVLESIPENVATLYVNGFWAGCNKFPQDEIYKNLRKLSRRGDKLCPQKLILRTSKHAFTNCIHNAYNVPDTRTMTLQIRDGAYFFHLYTASAKNRRCVCPTYCNILDKSFTESWSHAPN
jgi:hypothetical protein